MPPLPTIVHLDADAFFVSCELALRPELRGKKCAVGGRERGPFGTLLTVDAPRNSLVALAAVPSVHRIEPRRKIELRQPRQTIR